MADTPIKRGFTAPPEVTDYFDGKTDRPAFSWLDVWGEEHAYAFTVAKAVDAELRTVLRTGISRGINESRTFDNFLKDIQPELERLGWWKPRLVSDPTGIDPDQLVDFSSRRRLETIYWSNMKSARAAGQWQRAQRSKAGLPFFLYVRSSSANARAEHLSWVGVILPVDHPWWKTHFPPNGWGCACSVRQLGRREAATLLASEPTEAKPTRYVSEPPDDGPDREFRNRRTGEVTRVPVGIDPGWHTSPGLSRAKTMVDGLTAQLEEASPVDALPIVDELWEDPFVAVVPKMGGKVSLPAGVSPRLQEELGAPSPIVTVSSLEIQDQMNEHGMTVSDFAGLPTMINEAPPLPDLSAEPKENVRTLFGRIAKTWWRAIVRKPPIGLMVVQSLVKRTPSDVAFQILDAGLSRSSLVAIGFTDEAIEALTVDWKATRG